MAQQKAREEGRQLLIGVKRQNMSDILVRAHKHHAALLTVDPAHVKDVFPGFALGAEQLFIVLDLETPL